jgi:methylenetetrahydrofolate reductase (NADPH)
MSSLRETLRAGRFALTAEITPPLSTAREDLLEKARPLHGLADAVNVTDGSSARTHMDAIIAASLLLEAGIEPVLQLTCRDRNRIALQSELVGAAAMGIRNVLVLTGDDPTKGDQPDAKPVFDLDSTGLVRTAATIRDKGELLHGRKVGGKADYFIGVADAPIDPPDGWRPTSLAKKLAAGADFAQTQFCMDIEVVKRYVARLRESGVPESFYLLIGVAPLASAKSANFIRNNLFGSIIPASFVERLEQAADPKAEGRAICIDYLHQLSEVDGVHGAHIMAPLNESATPAVISAFRKMM